ncbi:MAG: ThuA domain-containing protein [Chloroflexi bacterium]|nr:ThuA domain-containing protein [Chloroflexota bacterium]MDA1003114.1 ThuA domain-containing protein [Chloroflexota bacterium]
MSNEVIRAHLIAGGYPPGQPAGHDHDYARLKILEQLNERDNVHATVAGDYTDIEKWLPQSQLLITYVAGPFANDEQNTVMRQWVEAGGRWLALHGSSGGKAARMPDSNRRTMVKMPYHETLGGFFLTHPPIRKFTVEIDDKKHPLTKGLPESFETIDEPYMVELTKPDQTEVVMTSDWGPVPPGDSGFYYEKDTSTLPGGTRRAIAFVRRISQGAVAYTTLGHKHTPTTNSQRTVDVSVAADGKPPLDMMGSWGTEGFRTLLRNGIAWGLGEE